MELVGTQSPVLTVNGLGPVFFQNGGHSAHKLSIANGSYHRREDLDSPVDEMHEGDATTGGWPSRKSVLRGLSETLMRRSLTKIDLSQRGLTSTDARLVKMALVQNASVRVLKLGYNNLGDDGVQALAAGIAEHTALESLDLGFNNIGDDGCRALVDAIPADERVWTLHLAGNLIGEDGAMAIADLIRRRCFLRKLYLSGNRIGAGGVKVIVNAIKEAELIRKNDDEQIGDVEVTNVTGSESGLFTGMQELFLGGSDMGTGGCEAVASLLRTTTSIRTLSLTNCEIGDDSVTLLASQIKANRMDLPLESLQLSFNNISSKGIEKLTNAIWGSQTLHELLIDNNEIGDHGAQLVATVLPVLKSLRTLNVAFNGIKSTGMKLLMKAVSESESLQYLSLSGNPVDTVPAKFIAYALAHSRSLLSISLDHCSIAVEGQRQIVAGIVSNSRISLREIRGLNIGPVIVTLGFPDVMEHWNNDHVINFIHLMWERWGADSVNEEKEIDPLNFLPSNGRSNGKSAPLEAGVVVEIAKKAFRSLVQEGVDVFSRRPGYPTDEQAAPLADVAFDYSYSEFLHDDHDESESPMVSEQMPTRNNRSFVTPPEEVARTLVPDQSRKKRIVEWLCGNIQHLNKLAQKPFSSAELWQLHQHYFTPVVNESGGSVAPSPSPSAAAISSVPEVSRANSSEIQDAGFSGSVADDLAVPASDPSMQVSPHVLTSLPMLKRKVSYRFLGDAAVAPSPRIEVRSVGSASAMSVSMMIEGGPTGHTLPRKTKKARRNRTRISFLPRVKAKLESFLDVCHEKALVTMRQLYYVEQAILKGQVNPIDPMTTVRTHLTGDFAVDAEIIVVDMI